MDRAMSLPQGHELWFLILRFSEMPQHWRTNSPFRLAILRGFSLLLSQRINWLYDLLSLRLASAHHSSFPWTLLLLANHRRNTATLGEREALATAALHRYSREESDYLSWGTPDSPCASEIDTPVALKPQFLTSASHSLIKRQQCKEIL